MFSCEIKKPIWQPFEFAGFSNNAENVAQSWTRHGLLTIEKNLEIDALYLLS